MPLQTTPLTLQEGCNDEITKTKAMEESQSDCSNLQAIWKKMYSISNATIAVAQRSGFYMGISGVLTTQCYNFALRNYSGQKSDCGNAVLSLGKVLDLRSTYRNADVVQLMSSREARQFLTDLNEDLKTDKIKNLWTWTMSRPEINMDKQKAIRWLAALFQDNADRTQNSFAQYFKCGNGPLLAETYKNLIANIRANKTRAYPPGVEWNRDATYHFYMHAALAQELRARGASTQSSVLLPLLLDENYKAITDGVALPAISLRNALWATHDEKIISEKSIAIQKDKTLYDIYHAFAGATFALSSETLNFYRMKSDQFLRLYKEDRNLAIREGMDINLRIDGAQ